MPLEKKLMGLLHFQFGFVEIVENLSLQYIMNFFVKNVMKYHNIKNVIKFKKNYIKKGDKKMKTNLNQNTENTAVNCPYCNETCKAYKKDPDIPDCWDALWGDFWRSIDCKDCNRTAEDIAPM